jgi:4-hydroxy-tetrahydrodipicolinate reductase
MNIALIGYGRMGREIEEIAIKRGHMVILKIDIENMHEFNNLNFNKIDAAIEFTTPATAFANVVKCLEMKKPVVSGTTGWTEHYEQAAEICRNNGTSFIHSSNFSVGVNIVSRLNSRLASMMKERGEYSVSIKEIHHTRKLDKPSGTAISLADGIVRTHPGYRGWSRSEEKKEASVPVESLREGSVPGTHIIEWDSEIDRIILSHEAKGRKGFALGAVLAAEFISTRKGVFTMEDVLGF